MVNVEHTEKTMKEYSKEMKRFGAGVNIGAGVNKILSYLMQIDKQIT